MTVNSATIELIKRWEGFRPDAYLDTHASPPVWTIGYGTTARAGVGIKPAKGMKITERDATEYLHRAVDKFAANIRPSIRAPINANEFGAFVSLAYNIGPGRFKKSSALRHFNAGNKAKAADAILMWNRAGDKVMQGLKNRRADERALFLRPVSETAKPAGSSLETATHGWIAAIIGAIYAIFGGKK